MHITTVRDSVPAVVALVAKMLREPSFPTKELDVLRQERLAVLQEARSDPATLAFESLGRTLAPYAASDPRHEPTADEAIAHMAKVKRRDLVRLHAQLWGAGHLQISAVGDFDPTALRAAVDEHLEGWAAARPYQRLPRPFHDVPGQGPTYIDTPDKEMAMVLMGQTLALRDDDPDHAALLLGNHILGGAVESRLMERLRQQEGWSYSAFSYIDVESIEHSGAFVAGAQCAPQNAERVRAAMREEIERLLREGITDTELAAAKASYRAAFDTALSDDQYVGGQQLGDLFFGRTMHFTEKQNQAIAALDAETLRAALIRHIRKDRFVVVVAGDMAKAGRPTKR